jgi:hypothetical protein
MFYSLLGRVVWYGLKLVLRRKFGGASVPKPLLAALAVAVLAAVAGIVSRSRSDS